MPLQETISCFQSSFFTFSLFHMGNAKLQFVSLLGCYIVSLSPFSCSLLYGESSSDHMVFLSSDSAQGTNSSSRNSFFFYATLSQPTEWFSRACNKPCYLFWSLHFPRFEWLVNICIHLFYMRDSLKAMHTSYYL